MSRVSRVSRVTDSASQPGPPDLPRWVVWQRRPFPDANLLLLPGPAPALVDSGFVAHADQTLAWTRAHAPDLGLVVNTHWHSDHVGANGVLQRAGAGVAAHLHQHIVPRWGGDSNFFPIIAQTKAMPTLLGDTRDRVAQAWAALD